MTSGHLGPFSNFCWDNPGYKLTPELNLELTAHYLQAIEVQQGADDTRGCSWPASSRTS